MRKSLPFILLALSLAVVLPTMGQPNFSGTWKLDKSKSTSGHLPAHPSMIWEISHEGSQIKIRFKISRDQGEVEHDAVFTTDGKDCSNEVAGSPLTSTLKWDGDTLIIDSKHKHFSSYEKLSLSTDAKTLTLTRITRAQGRENEENLVFAKQ